MPDESDNDPQDPMQEVSGFDTNIVDVPATEATPEPEPPKNPLLTTNTSTRIALPRPPSRPGLPKPPPTSSSTKLPTVAPKAESATKEDRSAEKETINTDTQYLIKKLKNLPKPPGK